MVVPPPPTPPGPPARLAVLIPAAARDDVEDTVDSVRCWLPDAPVVVLNDSDRQLPRLRGDATVTVLPPLPYPRNALGGLWAKVCYGLRWLSANREWDIVLRLDADALVVRPGLAGAAAAAFAADPGTGLLGSYRTGPDGGRRDFAPAAAALAAAAGWRGLRRPALRRTLRRRLDEARRHGYQPGEHAIACALLMRRSLVDEWERRGWLDPGVTARAPLADDHLAGLLTYAAGYRIADAGGPGGLVAVQWRGLPGDPTSIVEGTAHVTHSVRSTDGRDEAATRRWFADRRRPASAVPAGERPGGSPL